jgi:hypothetical protein
VDPSSPTFWVLLRAEKCSMDLGLGCLGPHTGTVTGGPGSDLGHNWALNRAHRPLGPVWPAQLAQRRPFSVFVLPEFSNFEKQKNLNTSARFSLGLFFFTFFAGTRGSSGTENQRQNSKFQNPLSRLEKCPLPVGPSSPTFWGAVGAENALWTSVSGAWGPALALLPAVRAPVWVKTGPRTGHTAHWAPLCGPHNRPKEGLFPFLS